MVLKTLIKKAKKMHKKHTAMGTIDLGSTLDKGKVAREGKQLRKKLKKARKK